MRPIFFLATALFCVSCGSSTKPNRAKAPDDISETVFRYQFAQFQHSAERIYFLKISGQDPSDDFMQRFKEAKPIARKGSESSAGVYTRDKETGARGVTCDIGSIKWVGDTKVEVPASYSLGNKSRVQYSFSLAWERGKWKVTGKRFLRAS